MPVFLPPNLGGFGQYPLVALRNVHEDYFQKYQYYEQRNDQRDDIGHQSLGLTLDHSVVKYPQNLDHEQQPKHRLGQPNVEAVALRKTRIAEGDVKLIGIEKKHEQHREEGETDEACR